MLPWSIIAFNITYLLFHVQSLAPVYKMPLCTIHLLSLYPTSTNHTPFLKHLQSLTPKPLVVSRVIRWIILPKQISTENLLARNIHWDYLIILPHTNGLPDSLKKQHIKEEWTITAGVPSRLLTSFDSKNARLLNPQSGDIPTLPTPNEHAVKTQPSSQNLELGADLESWIQQYISKSRNGGDGGAVSMFNLLSFLPGMKDSYLKYGKAFGESVGKRFGGDAKVVGNVVINNKSEGGKGGGKEGEQWNEIALAHYPSILHFRAMLLSEDYQAANQRWRVPSLRDTAILMTSEVGVWEGVGGDGGAKL